MAHTERRAIDRSGAKGRLKKVPATVQNGIGILKRKQRN
jgi:hypothetical protein